MFRRETTNKKSIGQTGEDLAAEHLTGLGYEVLDRNVREKFGEVDILAADRRGVIHFVEVKAISSGYADFSGMRPEDNLSGAKLAKMKKMAEWYANSHSEILKDRPWQIDLLAVVVGADGAAETRFYENIS
jgi:putative endonuclease